MLLVKKKRDIQSYSLFQKKIKSKQIEIDKMKLIIFNERFIMLKSTNFISVYW